MTDEEKAELRVLNALKRVENARTKQINELKLCEDAESSQRILESKDYAKEKQTTMENKPAI
jgi:hypothetical protein